MSLRNYINDLEFSKKVNLSERGKRFENSDFTKSVEACFSVAKDEGLSGKIYTTLMAPAIPGLAISLYGISKLMKKFSPETYRHFNNNPNLVLNR